VKQHEQCDYFSQQADEMANKLRGDDLLAMVELIYKQQG